MTRTWNLAIVLGNAFLTLRAASYRHFYQFYHMVTEPLGVMGNNGPLRSTLTSVAASCVDTRCPRALDKLWPPDFRRVSYLSIQIHSVVMEPHYLRLSRLADCDVSLCIPKLAAGSKLLKLTVDIWLAVEEMSQHLSAD